MISVVAKNEAKTLTILTPFGLWVCKDGISILTPFGLWVCKDGICSVRLTAIQIVGTAS
jgi:hypothetical protein